MKVTIERGYKDFYTLTDLESAKAIIKAEKEDEWTAKDAAEYAVKEALSGTDDYLDKVIEATARTAKNSRIHDAHGEGTGMMDVWIEATARTRKGYVEVGAYLSDIWQTGGTPYKHQMFIRTFWEVLT